MSSFVRFLVFAHGNIVNGDWGPEYDRAPVKKVKIAIGIGFSEFVRVICRAAGVDLSSTAVDIVHRHPHYMGNTVFYQLVRIADEEDLEGLLEMAISFGSDKIQDLYVQTCEPPLPVQEDDAMACIPSPVADHNNFSSYPPLETQPTLQELEMDPAVDPQMQADVEVQEEAAVDPEYDPEPLDENDAIPTCHDGWENRELPPDYHWADHHMVFEEDPDSEDDDEAPVLSEDGVGSSGPPHQQVRDAIPFYNIGGDEGLVEYDDRVNAMCSGTTSTDEMKKGMRFNTKDDLINFVNQWHVDNHFDYKVKESKSGLWDIFCKARAEQGCKWRLRACKKKLEGIFVISILEGPHTCVNPILGREHNRVNSKLLGKFFIPNVRDDPDVTCRHLRTEAIKHFRYQVSLRKVWIGRKKAIDAVYGDWYKSYNELPKLFTALKHSNPGTKVEWVLNHQAGTNTAHFSCVFWTFGPCVEAFKSCRPVLCIDGTFCYGRYKHTLLVAVSVDGDKHVVPVAFCLAPKETTEAWAFFLRCLKHHVVAPDRGETICLISDRGGGIISAVNNEANGWQYPFSVHRFCIRHVCSNLNKEIKNHQVKRLVDAAAHQAKRRKYDHYMQMVRDLSEDAIEWFNRTNQNGEPLLPKATWTLAFDGFYRFGYMTSNIAESYNSILKGARGLPVCALVKKIFYNCVIQWEKSILAARKNMGKNYVFTEQIMRMIEKWRARANTHQVITFRSDLGTFEVITGQRISNRGKRKGGRTQRVNLHRHTCSCRKWQIYRIPCSHAFAAAAEVNVDAMAFVGHWYRWSHQLQVYNGVFRPIGDELEWPTPTNFPEIIPMPGTEREQGKPRRKRFTMEMDIRERPDRTACSICGGLGHNMRTCAARHQVGNVDPQPPVIPFPRSRRGVGPVGPRRSTSSVPERVFSAPSTYSPIAETSMEVDASPSNPAEAYPSPNPPAPRNARLIRQSTTQDTGTRVYQPPQPPRNSSVEPRQFSRCSSSHLGDRRPQQRRESRPNLFDRLRNRLTRRGREPTDD